MSLRVFYGGTFDPVHDGHLAIALAARAALRCTIRMMPAADPPHRAAPGADAAQRVAMLDLAVAGHAGLVVDRRELRRAIERGGPSYSIDTVRELRAELGDAAPLALLMGADSFIALPTWKDWRALLDLVHVVVAQRPGSPLDGALPESLARMCTGRWTDAVRDLNSAPGGRVLRLAQPLHDESATAIRAAIAQAWPWRDRVPAPVADYIERHHLYRHEIAQA